MPASPIPFTEPQSTLLTGPGAPAVVPWKIKQLYIDILTGDIYQATGLEASSWVQTSYTVTPN